MGTLTSGPRLRNTSIIGKKFTVDADDMVRKNLDILNDILGKDVFVEYSEQDSSDDDDAIAQTEQEIQDADDKAEELRSVADDARTNAAKAETDAAVAQKDVEEAEMKLAAAESKGASFPHGHKDHKDLKLILTRLKNEIANKKRHHTILANKAKKLEADATLADIAADKQESLAKYKRDQLAQLLKNGMTAKPVTNDQFGLVGDLKKKPLSSKRYRKDDLKKKLVPAWKEDSFVYKIVNTPAGNLSISDCIDKVNELSSLKNTFKQYLNDQWVSLTDNQKIVLADTNGNILDYLVAYAYYVKGITNDVVALYNFVTKHPNGVAKVINYCVISSVRDVIVINKMEIDSDEDGTTFNDDDHSLMQTISKKNLSLRSDGFSFESNKLLREAILEDSEIKLIKYGLNKLGIDQKVVPDSYYPSLIRSIKNYGDEINVNNIAQFLPLFINNIKGDVSVDDDSMDSEDVNTEADFEVEFLNDQASFSAINVPNIKCAAQLFTSLVMETELDIISLANYFTDNFSLKNRINITDPRLRDTLDMFMFDHKFTTPNRNTGRLDEKKRTRASERQYFYRQVFNFGNGPVPEGVVVNTKFPKLWNKLIPVVKSYLENSSASLNSNTFVSKGGVTTLISALQNNLSVNCTSMTSVMSPRINAEWNFIIKNIFSHQEVITQVSPANPSWKGVVETLYASLRRKNVDAELAYTKAQISYSILDKIANYDSASFDDDDTFLDFCTLVIQLDDCNQSVKEFMEDMEEDATESRNQYAPAQNKSAESAKVPQAAGGSEWDF